MPGKIKKMGKCFEVIWGRKKTAKCTTEKKAKAQLRLLYGVKSGWKPTNQ